MRSSTSTVPENSLAHYATRTPSGVSVTVLLSVPTTPGLMLELTTPAHPPNLASVLAPTTPFCNRHCHARTLHKRLFAKTSCTTVFILVLIIMYCLPTKPDLFTLQGHLLRLLLFSPKTHGPQHGDQPQTGTAQLHFLSLLSPYSPSALGEKLYNSPGTKWIAVAPSFLQQTRAILRGFLKSSRSSWKKRFAFLCVGP